MCEELIQGFDCVTSWSTLYYLSYKNTTVFNIMTSCCTFHLINEQNASEATKDIFLNTIPVTNTSMQ